jgi:hypothetical protein
MVEVEAAAAADAAEAIRIMIAAATQTKGALLILTRNPQQHPVMQPTRTLSVSIANTS